MEIADLRGQLDQQTKLAFSRNRELEEALVHAKLDNIRLSENVESYQVLLQERTLKGEYPDLGFAEDNQSETAPSRGNSRHGAEASGPTSLASELHDAEAGENSKILGIPAYHYRLFYSLAGRDSPSTRF